MEVQPIGVAFRRLLRDRRIESGLSGEAVGDLFGVKQQTISKWETGASRPDPKYFDALAAWLGTEYDELVLMIFSKEPAAGIGRRLSRIEERLDQLAREVEGAGPAGEDSPG